MCKRIKTTNIAKPGKAPVQYAKVADRLLDFRAKNPRSKIAQRESRDEDGNVTVKAYIWKDKTEYMELLKSGVSAEIALESADAEGSALAMASEITGQKGYEKHETIAIGRALALLGYAASGEIASSEEMEQFEEFKEEKRQELIAEPIKKLDESKDLNELKEIWAKFPAEIKRDEDVVLHKEAMKIKLSKKEEK